LGREDTIGQYPFKLFMGFFFLSPTIAMNGKRVKGLPDGKGMKSMD